MNDKASRFGTGVGSFLSNVMQNPVSRESNKIEQSAPLEISDASKVPVGSVMPESSSSSVSPTLKDVSTTGKAVEQSEAQQELALASYQARKEEERVKTAEKIAAARARYFLRRDRKRMPV